LKHYVGTALGKFWKGLTSNIAVKGGRVKLNTEPNFTPTIKANVSKTV